MVLGNVHPRIGSTMFVQGQRSAMFLWQCSSKVVVMFLRLDAFKEMKRIQHYIRLLVFFTTLQESLRLQKDIMPGLKYKDFSATLKLPPPCRNELLRSKTACLDG